MFLQGRRKWLSSNAWGLIPIQQLLRALTFQLLPGRLDLGLDQLLVLLALRGQFHLQFGDAFLVRLEPVLQWGVDAAQPVGELGHFALGPLLARHQFGAL